MIVIIKILQSEKVIACALARPLIPSIKLYKFNIHTRKAEFLPAAGNPEYGSLDLCLAIEGSIEDAEKEIKEKGGAIEEGPVTRHGALGEMKSIYLRDPDGNLIELASYEG